MRLVSIISVWSDCIELLPFCIENHLQFCDGIIVMWSASSNHFVKDDRMLQFVATHKYDRVLFHQLEPARSLKPLVNETRKRNQGIEVAKREGYSHFFTSDADEFYLSSEVEKDKMLFEQSEINGVVCRLKVYVGSPTLWCEDSTLVPFIHKLSPHIKCGRIHDYPFAYKNKISVIDPSRRMNEKHGIIMSDTTMHHMSLVRNDIKLKANNSTAKRLRNRISTIKLDMQRAKPGYVTQFYGRPLQESPNYFDICI